MGKIWDDYVVDLAKEFIVSQKVNPTSRDMEENSYHLVLFNLFLIRRAIDFNFRLDVDHAIAKESNKQIWEKALNAMSNNLSQFEERDDKREKDKFSRGFFLPTPLSTNEYYHIDWPVSGQIFVDNSELSIEYIKNRLAYAHINSNYDEIQILEALLSEKANGKFVLYSILKNRYAIKGSLYEDTFRYKINRFIFTKIKDRALYWHSRQFFQGRTDIFSEINVVSKIVNIIKDILEFKDSRQTIESQAIKDIIWLICSEWFMTKPIGEKLVILNREYLPDKKTISSSAETIIETLNPNTIEILELANEICQKGFYQEASYLLARIIEIKSEENLSCELIKLNNRLARILIKLEDYGKAKIILENALIKYHHPGCPECLLSYIFLLHISFQTEDRRKMEETEKILKQELKDVSIETMVKSCLILSKIYKEQGLYEKELHWLTKAMGGIPVELINEEILERHSWLQMLRSGNITWLELFSIDMYKRIKDSYLRAEMLWGSFQIKRARELFEKCVKFCVKWFKYGHSGIQDFVCEDVKNTHLFSLFNITCISINQREYHTSQKLLKQIIQAKPSHHNSSSLLLLVFFLLKKDVPTWISEIILVYDEEELTELTRFYIENIFEVSDFAENKLGFLVTLLKNVLSSSGQEKYVRTDFFLDVANKFADLGFLEEAIDYYQMPDYSFFSNDLKALYLSGIGAAFANLDKHKTAIQYFRRVLKLNPSNTITTTTTIGNLSASYGALMEFGEAIEFLKQFINRVDPETTPSEVIERRKLELSYYEKMKEMKLLLNRIASNEKEILKAFEIAETSYLNYCTEDNTVISTSIIFYYTKATEILLHYALAQRYLEHLRKNRKLLFPNKVWKDSNSALKNLICSYKRGDTRSLSLGQWIFILEHKEDPLNQDFLRFLETIITKNGSDKIAKSLRKQIKELENENIVSIRNKISHIKFIENVELKRVRTAFLEIINEIILILYPFDE